MSAVQPIHGDSSAAPDLVFDIGGTWFRSALFTSAGTLAEDSRRPAKSFRSDPGASITALQQGLIEYLREEVARHQEVNPRIRNAVLSMGAALNAHSGFVLNSGPLWGPDCQPLDLPQRLREEIPGVRWHVLNDVTAALLRHIHSQSSPRRGRTVLITISSGIAARVFDHARDQVPTDAIHGLQGEIGHLEVPFSFRQEPLRLDCDCGGPSHLNAYASGRGLQALAALLHDLPNPESPLPPAPASGSTSFRAEDLLRTAQRGDPWSLEVLHAAYRPLAQILTVMVTHDPEIESIALVGGVAATLGELLVEILLTELDALGLYQISDRDPGYFRRRLCLGALDDHSGLIGCGLHLRSLTTDPP